MSHAIAVADNEFFENEVRVEFLMRFNRCGLFPLLAVLVWLGRGFNIILLVSCSVIFYFAVLMLLRGITSSDLKLIQQLVSSKKN